MADQLRPCNTGFFGSRRNPIIIPVHGILTTRFVAWPHRQVALPIRTADRLLLRCEGPPPKIAIQRLLERTISVKPLQRHALTGRHELAAQPRKRAEMVFCRCQAATESRIARKSRSWTAMRRSAGSADAKWLQRTRARINPGKPSQGHRAIDGDRAVAGTPARSL